MIAGAHAVLWVRQDGAGNDACRFADADGGYLIDGSSTDAGWNILRYRIRARKDGTTRRVRIGAKSRIFVQRTTNDAWTLNGAPAPDVEGAKDIYLGFTPASMTLPIRRLKLDIGDEATFLVASLDLANEQLEPLHLTLRRITSLEYKCLQTETGGTSCLSVNQHGIVQIAKGRWVAQK